MPRFNILAVSKLYQVLKVTTQKKLTDFSRQRNLLTTAFDKYEEYIGVKEVRLSQQQVLQSESEFISSSRQRREVHAQLSQVQEQLKQIRQRLGESIDCFDCFILNPFSISNQIPSIVEMKRT